MRFVQRPTGLDTPNFEQVAAPMVGPIDRAYLDGPVQLQHSTSGESTLNVRAGIRTYQLT